MTPNSEVQNMYWIFRSREVHRFSPENILVGLQKQI